MFVPLRMCSFTARLLGCLVVAAGLGAVAPASPASAWPNNEPQQGEERLLRVCPSGWTCEGSTDFVDNTRELKTEAEIRSSEGPLYTQLDDSPLVNDLWRWSDSRIGWVDARQWAHVPIQLPNQTRVTISGAFDIAGLNPGTEGANAAAAAGIGWYIRWSGCGYAPCLRHGEVARTAGWWYKEWTEPEAGDQQPFEATLTAAPGHVVSDVVLEYYAISEVEIYDPCDPCTVQIAKAEALTRLVDLKVSARRD